MFEGPDEKAIKREKEKGRTLRHSQWWQARLSAGICHYCGKTFKREELTMDHVVPLSRSGKSVKGNVVVSCKPCNSEKKHHTPVDLILDEMGK